MDIIKISAKTFTEINFRDDDDPHQITAVVTDLSKVSDGFHTIAELYDHRITLYIALAKALNKQMAEQMHDDTSDMHAYSVWRSKTHSDGKSAYDGWFIMGIGMLKGNQISYHIPLSRWDETNFAETLEKAPEWDGHTSADVLERLRKL